MRPYFVSLIYQNNEEVLESTVCYTVTSSVFNAQTLTLFAAEIGTRLQSAFNGAQFPESFEILAVRVRTPSVGSVGGPSFVENQLDGFKGMNTSGTMDILFANCQLAGVRSNGKPVRGGFKLSAVPFDVVDCNVLTGLYIGIVEAQINNWFPQQLTINEEIATLSIESKPKVGDVEYVPASTFSVSGQVGTRIDRVLDRKYKRKKKDEDVGPEEPA